MKLYWSAALSIFGAIRNTLLPQQEILGTYLQDHPHSLLTDHFLAILGDLSMQQHEYDQAIKYYDQIKKSELQTHIQLKKWQALYQLGLYAQLYEESALQRPYLNEEGLF